MVHGAADSRRFLCTHPPSPSCRLDPGRTERYGEGEQGIELPILQARLFLGRQWHVLRGTQASLIRKVSQHECFDYPSLGISTQLIAGATTLVAANAWLAR